MVEPNSLNEGRPLPMKNLKQSSIKIGGNSNMLSCISEQAQQFVKPTMRSSTTNTSQTEMLKKYLKGHHFELGGVNSVPSYETISRLAHG